MEITLATRGMSAHCGTLAVLAKTAMIDGLGGC
jgi:hypothetical protein